MHVTNQHQYSDKLALLIVHFVDGGRKNKKNLHHVLSERFLTLVMPPHFC